MTASVLAGARRHKQSKISLMDQNMKKTNRISQIFSFSLIAATCCISVNAVPITGIEVSTIGGNYNATTHDYRTVGGPVNGATVRYDDSSSSQIIDAAFTLRTSVGGVVMANTISADGLTISYSGLGTILLKNTDDTVALSANLLSLSMQLTGGGLYSGTGQFAVTGGSLAADFGALGGIGSFGLSTRGGGTDFNHDFGGFVNVFLTAQLPGVPGVPDGGWTLSLLGISMLSLSAGYRKFACR